MFNIEDKLGEIQQKDPGKQTCQTNNIKRMYVGECEVL